MAVSARVSPPTNCENIVLRIMPLIGNPALIAQGVILVPSFTSQGFDMEEKRKRAFFSCLSVLCSNANSVLSKEITAGDIILCKCGCKDRAHAFTFITPYICIKFYKWSHAKHHPALL